MSDPTVSARQREKYVRMGLAVTAVTGALGLWWLLSISGLINPVLLPSPPEVVVALIEAFQDGTLWTNIWASLLRVVQGFLLGFAIAVPVGVLMGNSKIFHGLIE